MPAPSWRPVRAFALLLSILLLAAAPALAMQEAPPAAPTANEPAAGGATATDLAQPLPPPETDLRGRFDFAFDKLSAGLTAFIAWLPLLAVAVLIVAFAAWLAGFVSRRLHLLRLRTDNPYMNGLIRNVVRAVIVLFGVVVALNLLNATALVTAVLGSAGVVGLVLGFAFKDIAENYVAGILLSLRQPFAPGHHVVIDGNEGKVVALHSRTTVLMTMEGNELRLPNALVFKAIILNYSRNPNRRFDFTIPIDLAQSIRSAQSLALEQICGIDGLLQDPGPSWTVHEYGPGGIVLRFFGWVDQRSSDLGKVRSEAIRRVKAAFAEAGIEAPRTTYHILNVRTAVDDAPSAQVEPVNGAIADTSVNRDIDRQLAQAQQEAAADTNLLEPPTGNP
ncbi:mechanosensitive ion channel family protein [Luteimonas composti]|uniref:Small-conductance mechanosensitive channel n=1 Tax=Luteimonas composti TaxID=398257 RepID=A0ABT6MLU3_9GAMM|nr:mechanosensitive ion channel family protein [Luteimonas composti]MDH7451575.1 mechanosensitive ion channel family protein [Luteimonas composti]